MLLAIDTATKFISIALYDGTQVWGEQTWLSERQHTVELMPNVMRMMNQCQISPAELTGIAVSTGPGSFSGMRVGLATAKGICYANNIPLVGISSLEIVAYPHANRRMPICAVVRAGRKRFCIAFYQLHRRKWKRLSDFRLVTEEKLVNLLAPQTLVCGEINAEAAALLVQRFGANITIASPAETVRRAGYLAELGWARLSAGEKDDLATLEPIYLSS